jgi:hypothetical protein
MINGVVLSLLAEDIGSVTHSLELKPDHENLSHAD